MNVTHDSLYEQFKQPIAQKQMIKERYSTNSSEQLSENKVYATSPNICNKLLNHGADVSLMNYSGEMAFYAQPSAWTNMFANANISSSHILYVIVLQQ